MPPPLRAPTLALLHRLPWDGSGGQREALGSICPRSFRKKPDPEQDEPSCPSAVGHGQKLAGRDKRRGRERWKWTGFPPKSRVIFR